MSLCYSTMHQLVSVFNVLCFTVLLNSDKVNCSIPHFMMWTLCFFACNPVVHCASVCVCVCVHFALIKILMPYNQYRNTKLRLFDSYEL